MYHAYVPRMQLLGKLLCRSGRHPKRFISCNTVCSGPASIFFLPGRYNKPVSKRHNEEVDPLCTRFQCTRFLVCELTAICIQIVDPLPGRADTVGRNRPRLPIAETYVTLDLYPLCLVSLRLSFENRVYLYTMSYNMFK